MSFFFVCTGGAAISVAEQFLREKQEDSCHVPGSPHSLLSYFEASYLSPIRIGERYSLELDGTTRDMHNRKTSTINLLSHDGTIAHRIYCFDSHK